MAQSGHRMHGMHGARARPPARGKDERGAMTAPASNLTDGAFDLPLLAPADKPEEHSDGEDEHNEPHNDTNDDVDVVVADVLWVVAQVHFVVGRDVQLQVLGEAWLVSGPPPPPLIPRSTRCHGDYSQTLPDSRGASEDVMVGAAVGE